MKRLVKASVFVFLSALIASQASADPWPEHKRVLEELERNIYKNQQELDTLVERKKNTRERARIEQTLQRIVEIHAELISLRKNMDGLRTHLKKDHPEKAHILDDYDSRMLAYRKRSSSSKSPLSKDLDDLLIKVQMKYSTFMKVEDRSKDAEAVDKMVQQKRKVKKEREADVYLRKRSKVKLIK